MLFSSFQCSLFAANIVGNSPAVLAINGFATLVFESSHTVQIRDFNILKLFTEVYFQACVPAASKNTIGFKNGQNLLENNYFTLLCLNPDTICTNLISYLCENLDLAYRSFAIHIQNNLKPYGPFKEYVTVSPNEPWGRQGGGLYVT